MRKSFYVAAALLFSSAPAFATPATQPMPEVSGHDYCTSGAGFAPCPKLAWDRGATASVALVVVPVQPGNQQQAANDWCTGDGGLIKCPRIDLPTAARPWTSLMDVATLGLRVE